MSHQTSVSLQEKFCLCFCFQDVSVANGTTALLHTEHIWYPRIREVNDEHCLLRLLCVSSHLQCWSCPVYWSCLHWALFFSSYWYVHLCCEIQFRWHRYKIKLVEVLCATRQYCFLPSFLSFFLFLLSCAATDLSAYTLQHNQPRDMAPFGGSHRVDRLQNDLFLPQCLSVLVEGIKAICLLRCTWIE